MYTNTQQPLLPYRLASFVAAILGLSDYGPYVSHIAKPSSYDAPQESSSNTCVAEFGLTNGCHLPSYFSQAYNLDPLYARADGAGQTVGIVTLAAVDPGSPEYFWTNIAHVNRSGSLIVDNVDGGPGRAQRRLGHGRDRPGHRAVRGPRSGRERDRLPGAEHRLRVRRRVLHRGQPEHRQWRLGELGPVRDRDPVG